MVRLHIATLLLAVGALPATAAAAEPAPVLVELFTSQGCSSCPAADTVLSDLARREDVVGLSFHVGYWDYGGWKDPFAQVANSQRQRAYRDAFGLTYLFTPQFVIGGRISAPGLSRDEALAAIERVKAEPQVEVGVNRAADGNGWVTVGEGRGPGTVWLAVFDSQRETRVRRGENDGRTLINRNVVRRMRPMGGWAGMPATFMVPMPEMPAAGQGAAVFLQTGTIGPILGAAIFHPPEITAKQ